MKRYQVYLNPHSVSLLDEAAKLAGFSRSQLIQELVDGAATRIGNLLSVVKPNIPKDYSWFKTMIGQTKVPGKKTVKISENVDQIYYR